MYGLIAEEVEEIFPELVCYNKDNELVSVLYDLLPALMIKEIQKNNHRLTECVKNNNKLEEDIEKNSNLLEQLMKAIATFEDE
jgi:hypothetical protein